MKPIVPFLVGPLFILNMVALFFIQYATVGHGLDGFLHSTSWFITEIPRTHTLRDAFPIFACMALLTAAPVFLFDRTRRGLIGFCFAAVLAMVAFAGIGRRLPAKMDEYSVFSNGAIERSELMRIYGTKVVYYRHGRSYAVEINPHHLVQGGRWVGATMQTYEFVRNGLYQSPVSQDPDHNGSWQTDYCLRFNVEAAGRYERIVFQSHFIQPDELVSCPKDEV